MAKKPTKLMLQQIIGAYQTALYIVSQAHSEDPAAVSQIKFTEAFLSNILNDLNSAFEKKYVKK